MPPCSNSSACHFPTEHHTVLEPRIPRIDVSELKNIVIIWILRPRICEMFGQVFLNLAQLSDRAKPRSPSCIIIRFCSKEPITPAASAAAAVAAVAAAAAATTRLQQEGDAGAGKKKGKGRSRRIFN